MYTYRVRAYNSAGNSAYTGETAVTTSAPAAPTGLEAAALSSTSIKLTWKDNSHNEAGFKIERKTNGGSYAQVGTAGVDATAFTDTGLKANTTYYYRVRAHNPIGNSAYCKEISASTVYVPGAPANLRAETVSGSQINLYWTNKATNATGFKIERKTEGGSFAQIGAVNQSIISYADKGLKSDTVYCYRVRAYNAAGDSAYSGEVKASTAKAAAPEVKKKVIVLGAGKTEYYVDGQRRVMDAAPIIAEGRTFLPIRFVAEPIGAALGWEAAQQKVTITFEGKVIELWIGSNAARVDGKLVSIDPDNLNIKPMILPPGRTMLPLRFVSENLGCQVDWNEGTRQITVTYPAP